ncbi:MAG TPA: hypothetical protein VEB63_12370 [Chitinophagaceae bacterium]|nr:hypothetical protein [Chitinophagaceae bacterium]
MPIFFYSAGILFCVSGLFLFYRNAFEDDKRVQRPLLLLAMGVVLIAIGTARDLGLIR